MVIRYGYHRNAPKKSAEQSFIQGKKLKLPAPTESHSAINLASYLRYAGCLFTKTAQETFTPFKNVLIKNKAEGVNPGLPDFIIFWRGRLVFLELKRVDHSNHCSEAQEKWRARLEHFQEQTKGLTSYILAYGHEEAISMLEALEPL